MLTNNKGFGLIELMLASVIAMIIMVGIYKYWISSIGKMSQTVQVTELRQNAQQIFQTLKEDIKFLGYNPLGLNVETTGESTFGVRHSYPSTYNVGGVTIESVCNTDRLNCLRYSAYNPKSPLCPTESADDSCCSDIWQDSNGVLYKTFWDETINGGSGGKNTIPLIRNACVQFIYWDTESNAPCPDQGIADTPCSNMMMLIMSVMPRKIIGKNFDSSGCLDETTNYQPCCDITDLDPSEYVKYKEKIRMTNLLLE